MATHTKRLVGADKLSPREREVMDLAARGLTNARIAEALDVSTHAVKFHLASVYRKLHAANRTEATALYVTTLSHEPGAG